MEQSTLERRFRRNGVEMPFHCLTIHAKQNKVSAENWGFHYHDYIEILYSLESDCDVYINDKIIPFKTLKDDAMNAFKGLKKGRPLLPNDFTSLENVENEKVEDEKLKNNLIKK